MVDVLVRKFRKKAHFEANEDKMEEQGIKEAVDTAMEQGAIPQNPTSSKVC